MLNQSNTNGFSFKLHIPGASPQVRNILESDEQGFARMKAFFHKKTIKAIKKMRKEEPKGYPFLIEVSITAINFQGKTAVMEATRLALRARKALI